MSRLDPTDLTDEDAALWNAVVLAAGPGMLGSILWTRSLMSDLADGALVFHFAAHPGLGQKDRNWYRAVRHLNVLPGTRI